MSEFLDTPELQDKVIVRLVDDDKDFLRYKKKTSRFPDASC